MQIILIIIDYYTIVNDNHFHYLLQIQPFSCVLLIQHFLLQF
jgi:hypothetical protein